MHRCPSTCGYNCLLWSAREGWGMDLGYLQGLPPAGNEICNEVDFSNVKKLFWEYFPGSSGSTLELKRGRHSNIYGYPNSGQPPCYHVLTTDFSCGTLRETVQWSMFSAGQITWVVSQNLAEEVIVNYRLREEPSSLNPWVSGCVAVKDGLVFVFFFASKSQTCSLKLLASDIEKLMFGCFYRSFQQTIPHLSHGHQ